MKQKVLERNVLAATKQILEIQGFKVYRINNVGIWNPVRQAHIFHGTKGLPDLIACSDDLVIFVECKGSKGRLTQEQQDFFDAANLKKTLCMIMYPENLKNLPTLLASAKASIK